jgi:hypothetical protein
MKKQPIDIDFPLPKKRLPKYVATAVASIAIGGAFMYAGAQLGSYMNPPKLPANQQCIASQQAVKEAAKTFSDQLVAAIDGADAPAPDLAKVKTASQECVETSGEVTVAVNQ